MIYRGYVRDGGVVLDEKIDLPDGVEVRIEPVEAPPKTLAERFKNVIGQAEDLPSDMAAQHDHYLYGTPNLGPHRSRQ
jgi:hypothetical protein